MINPRDKLISIVLLISVILGYSMQLCAQDQPTLITVFYDSDNDGERDSDEDKLIPGVQFLATDHEDNEVDVQDLSNGTYRITHDVRLRVEVIGLPEEYQEGAAGATSVFFVRPGVEIDIPVITSYRDSAEFDTTVVFADDLIVIPCYDPGAAEGKTVEPALIGFDYNVDGIAESNGGSEQNPMPFSRTVETGATWGVANQVSQSRVFTSALVKRHVGIGPQGVGGLYMYSILDSVLESYNLQGLTPAVGPIIDLGSIRRNIVSGSVGTDPYALSMTETQSYDVDAFDKVGKVGFGDIDINPDKDELWMVNLHQRSLMRLDVSGEEIDLSQIENYPIMDIPGVLDIDYAVTRNINCGAPIFVRLLDQDGSNRINDFIGAESFTDPNGLTWERNKYQIAGTTLYENFFIENAMSDGYTEKELYNTAAVGPQVSYRIPLVNDTYKITLHFAEPQYTAVGDRIFDIIVEDSVVMDSFDIIKAAGGINRATKLSFEVNLTDGELALDLLGLIGARTSEALISGFTIEGRRVMKTGVLRPWSIAFHEGRGYIGIVNDASISRSRDNLYAYILAFDPENIEAGFTKVLEFPLDYRRERVSYADVEEPRPFRTSSWEAWISNWGEAHLDNEVDRIQADYPQPIISDIDFNLQGEMIIGIMDRWGHQSGYENYIANPSFWIEGAEGTVSRSAMVNDNQLVQGYSAGDLLKACVDGVGFVLECENNDPGENYLGDDGPSFAGEFFYDDFFKVPGIANHGESFTGGLGIMPGQNQVVNSVYNPIVVDPTNPNYAFQGIFSQGIHVYDSEQGAKERAYLFIDQYTFGKANGLGDIEASSFRSEVISNNLPPFEIGNYIWVDSDKDGIQDPNEYGVPGVVVELYCVDEGTLVATTTTDAEGRYIFTDIESHKCYEIRVELSQPSFIGLEANVTQSNAGGNDNIDSDADGDRIPGFAVISYCTGIVNANDHSLDIGVTGPLAEDASDAVCTFAPGSSPLLGVFDFVALASDIDPSGLNIVEFYSTEAEAIASTSPIQDPDTFPTTILYSRVTSPVDRNIYSVSEVTLTVVDGTTDINFETMACEGEAVLFADHIEVDYNTLTLFEDNAFTTPLADQNSIIPSSFPTTVYYRAMADGSCMIQGALTISARPEPIIDAGNPGSVCMGEKLNLSLLGHSFDPNGSGATSARWSTNGFGMFVPSSEYGRALRYMSVDADTSLSQVWLYLDVTNYACANVMVRDSVPIQILDTCPRCPKSLNCYEGINFPCGSRIRIEDVVSSDVRPQDLVYYSMKITNEWGQEIPNPLPIDFTGSFTITITTSPECGGQTCMTMGTIKPDQTCVFEGGLDTAVWCIDTFLQLDPSSEAYERYKPIAKLPCRGTRFTTRFIGDEEIPQPDDSDTAKIILRCWEGYLPGKDIRCTTCDTIAVLKLPELGPDNFIVPQKDTVHCVIDTTIQLTPVYDFLCWKHLVNLHSDGTYISYPKKRIDELIRISHVDSSFVRKISSYPLLTRNGKRFTVYDTSYFEVTGPANDPYYTLKVELGDSVLTNNGAYLIVDNSWFFGAGEQGVWIDLCMPYMTIKRDTTICDIWEIDSCNYYGGVKVILPNRPYDSDSCAVYCITEEIVESAKCCLVFDNSTELMSENCPRITRERFIIKQLCYASSVDQVSPDCPYKSDPSGIVKDENGLIEIEQWRTYEDKVSPIFVDVKGSLVANTGYHECKAVLSIPPVKFKDRCSGVKAVKVFVKGGGTRMISLTEGDDGYWYNTSGRELEVQYDPNGIYLVYEASDNCHNTALVDHVKVNIQDLTAPTAVHDDAITVSIGGKHSWVDVSQLAGESFDNCAIEIVLGRRKDWKTSYGVDLCHEDLDGISTEEELRDYLETYGIESVLGQSNIEKYYYDSYEWLKYDDIWCQDRENYIVEGWENEILNYWVQNCALGDEHGHPLSSSTIDVGLGGGWAKQIPVSCEDACDEIMVELLVIDQACNYTKAWMTLTVEDKSDISRACEFEDVYLSCASYNTNYKPVIDAALEAGNSSELAPEEFAAVDEILGGLLKGWKGDENELLDIDGQPIDKTFTYLNQQCIEHIDTLKRFDTTHDGTVLWVYEFDTTVVLEDHEEEVDLGGVFVLCGAYCEQDIWVELDECGVGTITRRWRVNSGCTEAHDHTTHVFEQKIHIRPSCELNTYMFDFPQDTTLCYPLQYDFETGNVILPVEDEVSYSLGDTECRQLGIGFDEEVLEVSGAENTYKILRKWVVNDWCSGQQFQHLQKIILVDTCELDASLRTVSVVFQDSEGEFIPEVLVDVFSRSNRSSQQHTAMDGRLDLSLSSEDHYLIDVSKDNEWGYGIDIMDVHLLHGHIIGRASLTGNQLISADVNMDGRINGLDLIGINRLLLRKSYTLPGGKSWLFFNTQTGEQDFSIPSGVRIDPIDFTGVKLGDVLHYKNVSRSSNFFTLYSSMSQDNDELTFALSSDQDKEALEALHLVFELDGNASLHSESVTTSLDDDYWHITDDGLLIICLPDVSSTRTYGQRDKSGSSLFQISMPRAFSGQEFGMPRLLTGEAVVNGTLRKVDVSSQHIAEGQQKQLELYQSIPNPTTDQAKVTFYLPSKERVQLLFYDVTGKILHKHTATYPEGLHHFMFQASHYGVQSGVLYYKIQTARNSAVQKMTVIK